jgi:hypothetical protein
MRRQAIRSALLGALLVPLAAACCGSPGSRCAAAQAAEEARPHSAEFIFSNLCDETMVVRTVEVTAGEFTLVHPQEKMGADGNATDLFVAYGDEVFLGEEYFTSGEYRLQGKVQAVGKEDAGTALELGFEVMLSLRGPVTVEVTLHREGEACAVRVVVTAGAEGGSRCYEPSQETGSSDCD